MLKLQINILMLEQEAKERQRLAGGDHGNQHTGGKVAVSAEPQQPPDEPKGEAAAQAAKLTPWGAFHLWGADAETAMPAKFLCVQNKT